MKQVMKRAGAGTPSANRITLLRDADGDGSGRDAHGVPRAPALAVRHGAGRQRPLRRQHRRACVRFPYATGADPHRRAPAARSTDLPAGPINHHWTKNVIASPDGTQALRDRRLEQQRRRERHGGRGGPRRDLGDRSRDAARSRVFATGLRNPNGMAWEPQTGALWTVVNERDELGSDLVPDYLTSVQDGAFYGWPYSYYGQHVDERVAAAAARPGRQGDRARLRARPAHGLARPGVVGGREPAGAVRATACSSASTARGTASRPAATR